jgi:transposase
MGFSDGAVERAMKIQEVVLRALSGEIHWFQAAEILGYSVRTLRRYRAGLEKWGYEGLFDHRRRTPSPRSVPLEEVKRILGLYRERYRGWNVRHFYQTACREHGLKVSYTFVKLALQGAGLVAKHKARGRHRRRRERRACFGEMLHIDGSKHAWLKSLPDEKQTLISVIDDATSRLLYSQLWPQESTEAVLVALREVVGRHGIPASIYSDRASWAFETPKAGMAVSKTHLTQVGEVLKRLGVEHIPSYSPQARGRSERMNGTLQGRLINELKLSGARSIAEANQYIRKSYLLTHNQAFSVEAREPGSSFVAADGVDLDEIFCRETLRHVGKDNVVTCGKLAFQISKQPGRRTCSGLAVLLRQHLDGSWSIHRGLQVLGRYDEYGRPVETAGPVENREPPRFPTRTLDAGKRRRRPQLPQAPATAS